MKFWCPPSIRWSGGGLNILGVGLTHSRKHLVKKVCLVLNSKITMVPSPKRRESTKIDIPWNKTHFNPQFNQ